MSEIEDAWRGGASRRNALIGLSTFIAASPVLAAQRDPAEPLDEVRRIPGIAEMRTTFDFEPVFEGNLPASTFEYTSHGDGSEFTLRRNRNAFDWVDIVRARPAVAASKVDLSSTLFGTTMTYPILVAPSSGQDSLHPEGERGMFRGATAASGTIDILSGAIGSSIERALKEVPGGTMWAQHYPVELLAGMQRSLEGIQAAGATCVVVTCDQQASVYERTLLLRNLGGRAVFPGDAAAAGVGGGNSAAATAAAAAARAAAGGPPVRGAVRYRVSDRRLWYSWDYIDAVRKVVKGKLVIKGILEPADALLAIEHGADGIIVSNHGGRSMDYGPSTLEVLPEIVGVVKGRVPVLVDGGFRRGADVFKALALGADAVCLGRAARWGLGAFGAAGAQRVLEIVQRELVAVAAAAGCASLAEIDGRTIRSRFG